jgi:hypothetical protein
MSKMIDSDRAMKPNLKTSKEWNELVTLYYHYCPYCEEDGEEICDGYEDSMAGKTIECPVCDKKYEVTK